MRLGIFVTVAALAAVIGMPTAKAERSEIGWMFAEFEKASAAQRRTTRTERRSRVRVASVQTTYDAVSDAEPRKRRTTRTVRAERRQRVRVASLGSQVAMTSAPTAYYSAGPRPGKWCGWWMRTQRGGGPEFNVAWNWRKYGSPTVPQVGAVVIWRHHVGEITGQTADGRWIVRSGNDGGRVRERARSVAGAVFRI
jgi:hypothetical protein